MSTVHHSKLDCAREKDHQQKEKERLYSTVPFSTGLPEMSSDKATLAFGTKDTTNSLVLKVVISSMKKNRDIIAPKQRHPSTVKHRDPETAPFTPPPCFSASPLGCCCFVSSKINTSHFCRYLLPLGHSQLSVTWKRRLQRHVTEDRRRDNVDPGIFSATQWCEICGWNVKVRDEEILYEGRIDGLRANK